MLLMEKNKNNRKNHSKKNNKENYNSIKTSFLYFLQEVLNQEKNTKIVNISGKS